MAHTKNMKSNTHSTKHDSHIIGGSVGAAIGAAAGAAAAGALEGAALGTMAGAPGMVAGVAIGAALGAIAGKDIAKSVNPDKEEAYWKNNHKHRHYFDSTVLYDSYAPAYRFGIEAYSTYVGRDFNEIEAQLEKQWNTEIHNDERGTSRLTWATAKLATRDAYERLCKNNPIKNHHPSKAEKKNEADAEAEDYKIWQ
jgi:hypothetical protein